MELVDIGLEYRDKPNEPDDNSTELPQENSETSKPNEPGDKSTGPDPKNKISNEDMFKWMHSFLKIYWNIKAIWKNIKTTKEFTEIVFLKLKNDEGSRQKVIEFVDATFEDHRVELELLDILLYFYSLSKDNNGPQLVQIDEECEKKLNACNAILNKN